MKKDFLFVVLLIAVSPLAFLLMPAIGILTGLAGVVILIRSLRHA